MCAINFAHSARLDLPLQPPCFPCPRHDILDGRRGARPRDACLVCSAGSAAEHHPGAGRDAISAPRWQSLMEGPDRGHHASVYNVSLNNPDMN